MIASGDLMANSAKEVFHKARWSTINFWRSSLRHADAAQVTLVDNADGTGYLMTGQYCGTPMGQCWSTNGYYCSC